MSVGAAVRRRRRATGNSQPFEQSRGACLLLLDREQTIFESMLSPNDEAGQCDADGDNRDDLGSDPGHGLSSVPNRAGSAFR